MKTAKNRASALLCVLLAVLLLCPASALAVGDSPDVSAEETAESEMEIPAGEEIVVEKEPPAGALSATDILADAQLIAHGMGAIGNLTVPNCLEGFLAQYEAGVRVFEADLRLSRDGQVVLRHDWWPEWQEGISWVHLPTRDQFVSTPISGKYTPLSFRDLLLLMEEYPDICIITDTKFMDSDVFFLQFDAMLNDARELGLSYLFDRIVVQVYSINMHIALDNDYAFPHYIYTLYNEGFGRTAEAFRERVALCAQQGIEGLTMWDYWWDPAYAPIAEEYGIKVYVHTVNDPAQARQLLESGIAGVYSDTLTPDSLVHKKGRGDPSVKIQRQV